MDVRGHKRATVKLHRIRFRHALLPDAIQMPMSEIQRPGKDLGHKLRKLATSIGPGIFIVGYIIGTGSVTSMAKSGAEHGMSLTWALALSCFCTYVLVVAISRLTILSRNTIIHVIRERFGSATAAFIILGLMATVVTSVMGVMGIATDVVRQWSTQALGFGISPIISAGVITAVLYTLFLSGSHKLFLRAMALIVGMMAMSFVAATFLVTPSARELLADLKPAIPQSENASLVLAAMIGTTMASVCIVTRSYLVSEQQWTVKDLKVENRDAMLSLTLTFIVSAAIMACAAGTMRPSGIPVDQAIDMVKTLEPLSGRFATAIFVAGIVAAAISSLFPNYVLGPWLACDFLNIPRKMNRPLTQFAVALVAALGFVVPVFGGQPVTVMIASQAISPVVMPLLIILLLILLNSKSVVGEHTNPLALNIGLVATLLFALFAFYTAVVGLIGKLDALA